MNNGTRIVKRLLALFLVAFMNINTMGAVVGDNDGSAFITKAEFDSLKNDFQAQIDQYNTSIDSKVDGAIASYLAGIGISKKIELEPIISNYQDIRWFHAPYIYVTKRKYTEFTKEAGHYDDTTGWRLLDMENRRQGYYNSIFQIIDTLPDGFSFMTVAMIAQPYNVPNAWGLRRPDVNSARDNTIYVVANPIDGKFVIPESGGLAAEAGHGYFYFATPHKADGNSSNALHTNANLLWNGINAGLSVKSYADNPNSWLKYGIENIKVKTDGSATWSMKSDMTNEATKDGVRTYPGYPWIDGSHGENLPVACGYHDVYFGDFWSKVGDGLCSAIRWKTRAQFEHDSENFVYGMWPPSVAGDVNVAPEPKKTTNGEGDFLDLSSSGHVVEIPVHLTDVSIHSASIWFTGTYYKTLAQGVDVSDHTSKGTALIRLPLFYRVNWNDFYSAVFKDNVNEPLHKSGGLPFIKNSEYNGTLQLKVTYEELTNVDDSYISLTPDNKIKFSLKNKPFNDTSASFLTGWRNLTQTGTQVSFNNLEETDKTIDLSVEVKKGSDVYLSIDPLTADGVYCKITNIKGTFIVDS